MSFRLLFVCTGNICRSPLAERLTRARLGPGTEGFRVRSAGTFAVSGKPMTPLAVDVLEELGGSAEGFASQPVTAELLTEADLVLTATAEHRAYTVRAASSLAPRVYTMREFAALVAETDRRGIVRLPHPADRARALIRQVALLRGDDPVLAKDDEDIDDPYGHPPETYRRTGVAVAEALTPALEIINFSG
ncbi:hypothetical protein [Rhizohabitans arisaemae]|uniref:arsenate reductase/protein-tyrosine-phosphatase family protein n=1 Tax=Rhizohabitans arisaemae TaxID=2720610 RepID=UPI0024B1C7FD|nr:hypothetical protein [Rhizohabitans arisaemae]